MINIATARLLKINLIVEKGLNRSLVDTRKVWNPKTESKRSFCEKHTIIQPKLYDKSYRFTSRRSYTFCNKNSIFNALMIV